MASKEVDTVRSSVVQVKIGNRTYDMVHSRNCSTCNHPARFKIEAKLLLNFGFPAVSRYVSELNVQHRDGSVEEWPELSAAAIRSHYDKGHCPIEGEVGRALAQQRAEERGIDMAESTGQYVDHVLVQKALLVSGYEELVKGNMKIEAKDLIAVSKMIGDREQAAEDGSSIEQWQDFMGVYFNSVQTVVTQDQWLEIIEMIKTHPVFQTMMATNNADNIEEAEVID